MTRARPLDARVANDGLWCAQLGLRIDRVDNQLVWGARCRSAGGNQLLRGERLRGRHAECVQACAERYAKRDTFDRACHQLEADDRGGLTRPRDERAAAVAGTDSGVGLQVLHTLEQADAAHDPAREREGQIATRWRADRVDVGTDRDWVQLDGQTGHHRAFGQAQSQQRDVDAAVDADHRGWEFAAVAQLHGRG